MGPRGLIASYLHWYPAPPARQADRRAGRAVDRCAGIRAAGSPWPRPAAGRRRGPQSRPGVHRPGHRHPGHLAVPAPARRPRTVLRRRPFDHHPGRPRDPPPARPAGLRRPRQQRTAVAHAGGRVRLRRRRRRAPAHRRHRGPRPPAPGEPARAPRVRVREEEAEHDQAHRHQRRRRPAAVVRRHPPRPDARRHRAAQRGHRRPAPRLPAGPRRGRLRLPGTGPRLPRPGQRPAQKPPNNAAPEQITGYEQRRKAQSSQRICVEHAIAEPRQWRALQRYIGRREYFEETMHAITALVSDRCAER